jgi:hypothetical protein
LNVPSLSRGLLRTAAWCAYGSAAVAAPGVLALIGMYAVLFTYGERHPAFSPLGLTSDVAVLVQYALALPIPVVLHQLFRARAPLISLTVMLVAMAAMLAIVVLQVLLLAGVLPFEEQIGFISSAFVILVIWFVATGQLGRSAGGLSRRAMLMSILGASYFAYPIWAIWLGGRLRRLSEGQVVSHATGDSASQGAW